MKRIFNLIICTTAIFALYSCGFFEDEKPSKETEGVKTIVELPDSIKKKIVEQDALMTELLNKVDTLTKEMNSTKAENADLKEKVAGLKSPKNTLTYVSICAFLLALVALLMSLFKSKGIKEERVFDIVEKCLDNSRRIKELQVNVNNLLSSQRNSRNTSLSSSTSSSDVDYRFQKLEKKIQEVVSYINTQKSAQTSQQDSYEYSNSQQERRSDVLRAGYANINTGKYFTKILDSNQETCVFSIKFKNESKGEFTIISLDKIKSRNGWQEVVEYTGSIEDANSFKEIDKGICEKYDENTWEVTKPLKIRLFK